MATTSLPNFDQRKLRERLSQWDAHTDTKAPLSTYQKDVLIELTKFSNDRPMPPDVKHFSFALNCKFVGGVIYF